VNRPLNWRLYWAAASHLGLILLTMAWPTLLAPPERVPVALILLLFTAPLLPTLRGVLAGRATSHLWTSLISLPYLLHALVELYSNPAIRPLAAVEALLALSLLASTLLYANRRDDCGCG
jgi:uncharacterized membrane protein